MPGASSTSPAGPHASRRAPYGAAEAAVNALHGGEVVYAGMSAEEKAYARGWVHGEDDMREGLPLDSTLAAEVSWYASGYRNGYEAGRWMRGTS